MIGAICRSKKIFLLLVIVTGLFIYTVINRNYLNQPNRDGFTKRDDVQHNLASKEDLTKERNEEASNQKPPISQQSTESPEVTDAPSTTRRNDNLKERKSDFDWDTQEEETTDSDEGEVGGIRVHKIPGPHHHPPYMISQEQNKKDHNSSIDYEEGHIIPKEIGNAKKSPEHEAKNNISQKANGNGLENVDHKPENGNVKENPQHNAENNISHNANENGRENVERKAEKVLAFTPTIAPDDEGDYQLDSQPRDEPLAVEDTKDKHHEHSIEKKDQFVHERAKPRIGILQSLLDDKPNDILTPYTICPQLGVRSTLTSNEVEGTKCKIRPSTETSCKEAYVAYETDQQPLHCDNLQGNSKICSLGEDREIHCDMSVCEDKFVYMTGIDPKYGIVKPPVSQASRIQIDSNKHLERLLNDFTAVNQENGFNFCFLRCKSKKSKEGFLEQLVMFPPAAQNNAESDKSLININIILLDSVSRPHFYRSMHKSVKTLRDIVHNPQINATVLDFELFQSLADYTFHNIRVLMSGKTDFDYKAHKEQHYGIEYLFKHLKSKGYYTILQEDSCWYDEWGSLYTDNLFQGNKPENLKDFKARWKIFKEKIKNYYIDDLGLSHFSCEALERYNITNQFNQPRKICFGGKVFAEYFLDYNERVFNENNDSKRPILAYTHLNTGHEISGTRIKQLDQRLADFFLSMAKKENTLTLVFSDHGPKTTRYAFRTMSGRSEIYDSLMFIILPEKASSILGYQRTKALITNQKRLITAFDLHHTLMSVADENRQHSGLSTLEGIFAEVSPNRTCSDVPIKSSAICKCQGWDEYFAVNHPPFIWLAELALGTLNNKIQNDFLKGDEGIGGFGKCQRLTGRRFEKIRRRAIGDKYKVTMDLIVNPETEIFEVQIEYPKIPRPSDNEVRVTHLSRISIYRRFEKCKDKSVDLTRCVCRSRKNSSYRKWISADSRKNLLRILSRKDNFGSQPKFNDLHASCLVMVTRTHSLRTSVFEIANLCVNRSYRVKVTGKSRGKAITSTSFPVTLEVKALTVHFLFSVYHLEKPYGFKATTSYKAHFVDQ